jgi:hypothetical protein
MRARIYRSLLICLLLVSSYGHNVYADSSASPNYRVDQTFFGSGGELDASSAQYRARQTLGEVAAGNTQGNLYQAYAGFNTTDEPFIEFFVNESNIDIGFLDISSASSTSGTFYVRAWQADGYVVRTESPPPSNTSPDIDHELAPLTTGGASSPGTEQFGINLVFNDDFCGVGCDLGADPLQVPDNTFAFGAAATGYDTGNVFRYNRGEVVAQSTKSTSRTIYTVSYLFNIAPDTPAGEYQFKHNLVATATY